MNKLFEIINAIIFTLIIFSVAYNDIVYDKQPTNMQLFTLIVVGFSLSFFSEQKSE